MKRKEMKEKIERLERRIEDLEVRICSLEKTSHELTHSFKYNLGDVVRVEVGGIEHEHLYVIIGREVRSDDYATGYRGKSMFGNWYKVLQYKENLSFSDFDSEGSSVHENFIKGKLKTIKIKISNNEDNS